MKERNDLDEQTNDKQEDNLYTLAEIRKLSAQDVERNWDKVARSLKHISGKED